MIDVIIPNWNGKQVLGDCLESLRRQTFHDFETVVVDNGSTDGSADFIHSDYPEVKLIPLDKNKGFAGGVNEGIRCTKGELVFLLNNDVVLDKNCLEELYKASMEFPSISFFATKMLFRNITGFINAVGDSFGVDGYARNIGIGEPDNGQYDRVREVFSACAGAALYRRSLFEEIGLFDEDFFLILEDIDLGFRAQLAGHRCYYIPTALVQHLHSASIVKHSSLQIYQTARNSLYVLAQNMPTILLVKYLWKIIRQRHRLAVNSIIHGHLVPFVMGELKFSGTMIITAKKRFGNYLLRQAPTTYINSILVDPIRKRIV